MFRALLLIFSVCISTSSAASAPVAPVNRNDPEPADLGSKRVSAASGAAVVVTANPLASEAALAVLKDGGHAVDALVTAQAVLAVVEPQSSGLGGGGFLLHWDASQQALEVLDGREIAPKRSRPADFLKPSGEPLSWRKATSRLNAIGIPGAVALLWDAHQKYGRLPWANTLEPAIRLARDGFRPSQRLLRSVRLAQRIGVDHSPAFQALYLPGGQPLQADQLFRNPVLARTLQDLARDGGSSFYRGSLAQRILRELTALQSRESGFRGWSQADLSDYVVIQRQPLCNELLQVQLCTVPPPSSGGLAVLQTIALLNEGKGLTGMTELKTWQQLATAQAWADADRLYWVHDPIDGAIPTGALLDPSYIQERTRTMRAFSSMHPFPGLPPGTTSYPFALPHQGQEQGTTQVTIVDVAGNLVSYTASVETVFGSRHLVAGMVMNNQLTDFSFEPTVRGKPVANRRLPGRRPSSSMAPMMVLRNGEPILALGSPGGRTIPHVLSRVLLASLIWKVPPEEAVALPLLSKRGTTLIVEKDSPLPWPISVEQLQRADQPIRFQRLGSGIALLQRIDGCWHGAADPRREGTALALPCASRR